MRIRWKLLLLLLATAVLPLVVVVVIDTRSTRSLGRQLGSTVKQQLIEGAQEELLRVLRSHATLLDRDRKVIELIVRRQAREAEWRLSTIAPPDTPGASYHSADYDDVSRRPPGMVSDTRYFKRSADGSRDPVDVSFDQQVIKLAPGVSPDAVRGDIDRLASMAPVYRELYDLNPRLIIWQYTSTDSGIHSCYPGHGGYPAEYDHRKRAWYTQIKDAGRFMFTPPYPEVSTERVAITAGMPVRDKGDRVVGVTAIDILLTDILHEVNLPHHLIDGANTLIVSLAQREQEEVGHHPVIIARQEYFEGRHHWRDQIELERVHSPDAGSLDGLVSDLRAGLTGVRRMRFCSAAGLCEEALWAYGPLGRQPEAGTHLVLVVPYDRVVASAEQIEDLVLNVTREMLAMVMTTIGFLTTIVVIVALLVAHTVTRPIRALVDATSRVAHGDLSASVDLTTGDELQELGESFNAMVPKLQDRIRVREALSVAMEVQQSLLPVGPPTVRGLDIAGVAIYCDETGGDYYDFLELTQPREGQLAVVIGDVTGHGVAAALLMATGRALWRSRMQLPGRLAEVITEINRHLAVDRVDGRFMTMMCLVIDADRRAVRWVGAGHDPVLIYDPSNDQFEELKGVDIPLGVSRSWTYQEFSREGLCEGQVLVIGTDGIWETRRADGRMYGKDRLRKVIREHGRDSADRISTAITESVAAFRGNGVRQADDITLVVVKIVPPDSR